MDIEKADFALLNAVSEDEWAAYLLAGDVSTESIMNKPSKPFYRIVPIDV